MERGKGDRIKLMDNDGDAGGDGRGNHVRF